MRANHSEAYTSLILCVYLNISRIQDSADSDERWRANEEPAAILAPAWGPALGRHSGHLSLIEIYMYCE